MSQRDTASRSPTQSWSSTVIFRHPKDSAALSVNHIAALPSCVGCGREICRRGQHHQYADCEVKGQPQCGSTTAPA